MDFADLEKWIVVDENEHSEEDDLSTTLLSIEHTTTSQASFPITIDSPHAAETAYIQDQQKSCNIIISSSTCCPSLPGELLEIIVSHLRRSPESLSILAQVNRQWYSICTPLLWRNPMPSTISKMRRLAHVIQSRSESSLRLAFLKPFLSHYNSPGPANDQDIEVSGIESGASTPKSTSSHHWYCSTGPGGGGINNNPLSLIHEFSLGGYEWDLYDEVLTSSSFIPYRLTKWWSKQWWLRLTRQIADKCPNLIRLDLSSCGTWITDESLSKILKHCSRIQDLSLSNCYKLSDESLSLIGSSIKNLKRIDLANIQRMTSSSLHSIIMDSNVQLLHLNISGCNISNASIIFIADFCPNLIHLNMENCFIGSEIALSILMLKCHRLEYLRLPFFSLHRSSNNNGDSGEDTPSSKILTALVKGRHNLKSFGLYMWHVDLDPYLKPLLERCPELTDLNLTGCSRIKRSLISSFTRIQRLNLTANSKIDDRFLKDLSCLPPSSLKWLDLSHCKVTHIGIDHIVEGCQRLESLILNFNGKLDLCHLKTTSLSLRHLAVCQSPCIGNCCMSVVKQRFPRLSSIDFSHCADVSDRLELQRLVLAMPSLERVGLSCCDRLFAHPQQQQQSSTSSTTAVSTTNNRFERAFALLHGKRKSNACSLQEQGRLGCFDVRIWSDPHPRKIDWYERLSGHNGERYCVISKKLNEFKLADFSNAIYL